MAVAHLRHNLRQGSLVPSPARRWPQLDLGWRCRHRGNEVQLLDPFSGNLVKRIHMSEGWDGHKELSTDIGLLCISEIYTPEKACTLNPATGAITTLLTTASTVTRYKNKRPCSYLCVLGQVLSTGEYKVLLVREYQDMLYEEPEQTYHVMTLDAGTQA